MAKRTLQVARRGNGGLTKATKPEGQGGKSNLYTRESAKVGPLTVLISSGVFVFSVFLMHVLKLIVNSSPV